VPSVSKKQHNFMAAIAHSPSFAKKAGVPQSVGKDFNEADKGRKFSKGGDMATKNLKAIFAGKETKAEEKAEKKAVGGSKTAYKKAEMKYEGEAAMKKGGMARSGKSASARADGIAQKGKTKGKLLCGGGMAKR